MGHDTRSPIARVFRRLFESGGTDGGKGEAHAGPNHAPIPTSDLKTRLDRREDVVVLDVRPARDFNGDLGHIGGALNIPLDELRERLPEIESRRDRPIAVICRTNRMSGKAVSVLREQGFSQAWLVDDGMMGWRKRGFATEGELPNPVAASTSSDACGGSVLPAGQRGEPRVGLRPARRGDSSPPDQSNGSRKAVTIIIQNAPYRGDNKAWHALRFAGAALAEDMKVRIHLLDDGAWLAHRGQTVPEGAVDLEKLLAELMEYGLEVRACGMAINDCKLDERDLIPGVQQGSMKALASWVRESDVVLTF